MQALSTAFLPSCGVIVNIDTENSWPVGSAGRPVRLAFVATNSTAAWSCVSLQAATHPESVLRLLSRPAHDRDFRQGLVVEVHLTEELEAGEEVRLSLAQSGATRYFPPQQIDDVTGLPYADDLR